MDSCDNSGFINYEFQFQDKIKGGDLKKVACTKIRACMHIFLCILKRKILVVAKERMLRF
jgi:hypothetical protein